MWIHKTGAGKQLPVRDVRAGMLLRANALMRGVSGVRLDIIQRFETFLNAGVTPHVLDLGSIGASGDLVPLATIAGALIGTDACFTVDFDGEEIDSLTALDRLGLPRLRLGPKEGLALINGTSVMTGIAANCLYEVGTLLTLTMGVHALIIQALRGTNQSFHPFIHQQKPHRGQIWVAAHMLDILANSRLIRDELDGQHDHREGELIQDRYSLRAIPQYIGPIVEGLAEIARQVEVEMNSANDNPLIDVEKQVTYHGANFLGQYIGMGMDNLRHYIGLLVKHLDVQIAFVVTPPFNSGLSPCLIGNVSRKANMGLKGLQLTANSIMPLLTFLGNSLVDRFPPHAEQFNQNINSQGFGAANLARQSIEMFRQYIAIALMFGVQAVDLQTYRVAEHYDASDYISPVTAQLYRAVRETVGCPPTPDRPYVYNDDEQSLEKHISDIATDIATGGRIPQAVGNVLTSLEIDTSL
jgi:phenylalanine ammonia-lyase